MIRLRLCFALKGHDPPSNRALPQAALKGGKSILVGPSAPGTIAAKSDGTEAFPPLQAAGPRSSRRPVCGTPALAFLCNPRPAPDPRLHRQPINSHPSANSQRENQRRIFPMGRTLRRGTTAGWRDRCVSSGRASQGRCLRRLVGQGFHSTLSTTREPGAKSFVCRNTSPHRPKCSGTGIIMTFSTASGPPSPRGVINE